ncbi:MAG TPA: lysophospholipase [Candidatus Binatia bacterium]|nr:lysophospholipase [Candidatus Binatia bacterium]
MTRSASADGTFAGAGGVPIHWERHEPTVVPRGAVLVAHGYAEHLGRYRGFVDHLTGRGLAVAGIDHRGHGRSGGPRGHCRRFDELVADVRTLADLADGWWPGVPRVLFGHSLGGLLAFIYLLRHPDTVRAGALSAPALRVPDAAPRALQMIALLLGRIAPGVAFSSSLDEHALARDPAVGPAYVADPLVHRRASAGFYCAVRAAQEEAFRDADRLRVTLRILQGDADRIVDPTGGFDLGKRLGERAELVVLPGYYHELLNEPAAERERVVELLDTWFDRWLATRVA